MGGVAADFYLNRELSAIDYFGRILALAEDPATPLLERAKYLAIFSTNLDSQQPKSDFSCTVTFSNPATASQQWRASAIRTRCSTGQCHDFW